MVIDAEVGGYGDTEYFEALAVVRRWLDETVLDVWAQLVAFDNFPPEPDSRPDVDVVPVIDELLEDLVDMGAEAAVEGNKGVVYVEKYVHGYLRRAVLRRWEREG